MSFLPYTGKSQTTWDTGPQLKSTAVSRLLSSAQIPSSHRKLYSDTIAGRKEYIDDGEATGILEAVT